MANIPKIIVDTTELDKATVKVQNLILLMEKLFELCKKSKVLSFLLMFDKKSVTNVDVENDIKY